MNILLRTVTLIVVGAPLIGWIALQYMIPHPLPVPCAVDDYDCRVTALNQVIQ